MAFSRNPYHLPTLRNYEQALKHYESIKPIRGRRHEVRPIGDRRRDAQTIHKLENGDIAARLYQTNCVVYHQDGSISINFGGWATMSTAEFIRSVSPFNASSHGYVQTQKGWFRVSKDDALKILPDGTPVNPIQEHKTMVDKKKAAAARKKVQEFVKWRKVTKALGGRFKYAHADTSYVLAKVCAGDASFYPIAASAYAYDWTGRELLKDLYSLEDCFLKVPVEVGVIAPRPRWN